MRIFAAFGALRDPRFARLYAAQTVSQVGDALTWVALALLAYELAGADAAVVLGVALTLRVSAYVLLSPWAGVLADRMERRTVLVATHLGRALVIGLMPLVTTVWQVYVLMFLLNALTAFFTPTNQATVPLVVGRADAGRAFALSSATTEVLGIVGPGIAGVLAAWVGGRVLFVFDAASFVLAGILVMTLPQLRVTHAAAVVSSRWSDVRDGTARLWSDAPVRFALLMELVAAISGALILTVTVVRVKGGLGLGDAEYGWVMALYGLGATVASLAFGAMGKGLSRPLVVLTGAVVTSVALLPADAAPFAPLLALWLMAGVGQNWVNLPTETLLAERTEEHAQGRVYGAHYAWSHLWWAFTYPLASLLGARFTEHAFLFGGVIALAALVVLVVFSRGWATSPRRAPRQADQRNQGRHLRRQRERDERRGGEPEEPPHDDAAHHPGGAVGGVELAVGGAAALRGCQAGHRRAQEALLQTHGGAPEDHPQDDGPGGGTEEQQGRGGQHQHG